MRLPATSWRLAALGALAVLAVDPAVAGPDFGARHRVGGFEFAADSERPWLYYVFPPSFALAPESAAGGQLFVTRYTGSAVHGDSGETFVRSLLRFRVAAVPHDPALLEAARLELAGETGQPGIALRPLPVAGIEATVVALGIDDEFEQPLEGGFFERTGQAATVFEEREFVLPLASRTAQAFAAAHEAGGLVLSLAYTVWTEALPPDQGGDLATGGSLEADDEAAPLEEAAAEAPSPVRLPALADTLPVPIAGVERVDLDLGAPPDYPALRVYCFDFADALRDDLYLKEVEFDAAGVAGGRTGYRVSFSVEDPAETVRSIRFPFAADISQPYRFRVLEVLFDGRVQDGEWQVRDNWAAIIDATSIPERSRAAPPGTAVHYMETRR
jgi:hypothetical protein